VRALSIAITSTVLGTGIVAISHVACLVHLDEVESTINTTWHLRNINSEGEFLVDKLEHLVLRVRVEHEGSGTNVLSSGSIRYEVHSQGLAIGGNTVWGFPVTQRNTLKCTVCGASGWVWAVLSVPVVTIVAVGVATVIVEPSPVLIEGDTFLRRLAAAASGTGLK